MLAETALAIDSIMLSKADEFGPFVAVIPVKPAGPAIVIIGFAPSEVWCRRCKSVKGTKSCQLRLQVAKTGVRYHSMQCTALLVRWNELEFRGGLGLRKEQEV